MTLLTERIKSSEGVDDLDDALRSMSALSDRGPLTAAWNGAAQTVVQLLVAEAASSSSGAENDDTMQLAVELLAKVAKRALPGDIAIDKIVQQRTVNSIVQCIASGKMWLQLSAIELLLNLLEKASENLVEAILQTPRYDAPHGDALFNKRSCSGKK